MSEVTVTAQANVLGLKTGQQVTIERTDLIDAHIASGYLAETVEGVHREPDLGSVEVPAPDPST